MFALQNYSTNCQGIPKPFPRETRSVHLNHDGQQRQRRLHRRNDTDALRVHGGATLGAEGSLHMSEAAPLSSPSDQGPSNPVWDATIFHQGGPGAELDSNPALWLPPVPVQKPKPPAKATPPNPTAATDDAAVTDEQFDAHAHHVLRCVHETPLRWWQCSRVGAWLPLQGYGEGPQSPGSVHNASDAWPPTRVLSSVDFFLLDRCHAHSRC